MIGNQERLTIQGVDRIVAVSSGKGGVGKSTVAVNLAIGLAQRGYRIGLLDADVQGPNVPLMMGVRRLQPAGGWAAMVPLATNQASRQEHLIPPLERFGIQMMSIGLLVGEEQTAMYENVSNIGWLVRNLLTMVDWGPLDLLLLDFPPGTGEPQSTLLNTVQLDGALIVITPQDLARLDSTRTLRSFEKAGIPVNGVIENMSYFVCPHCGEPVEIFHHGTVERPVSSGDVPLLGRLPLDPALSKAGDTGRPIPVGSADSALATELQALVEAVEQALKL